MEDLCVKTGFCPCDRRDLYGNPYCLYNRRGDFPAELYSGCCPYFRDLSGNISVQSLCDNACGDSHYFAPKKESDRDDRDQLLDTH